ncbi:MULTISPECIES: thiol:disulfide interchange protein DsbA/DsbL [unclassified Variovorax]|uniref:thiol:disulfide interchange protein DsbA/DsbL n=1 Tax=unclassified Variovorax TaxID=663243 RepID=UPI003F453035
MDRRKFSMAAVTLGLGVAAGRSQAQPILAKSGKDYLELSQRLPSEAPAGKVEVIEFFSYNCPHCNAFEPGLEAWLKSLPKEVAFRRVPAPFVGSDVEPKQRMFYALEAMGKVDAYQMRVFDAIHAQRQNLTGDANIIAWVGKNGIDGDKFAEIFKSFAVVNKAKRASQLVDAYQVAGVPAMGVAGRWYVDGELAGGGPRTLQVVNYLMSQALRV